jgi:dTDP-4-amino-4,6-dideoxygalactose transaminase/methionyl-tRNA formyltransferase
MIERNAPGKPGILVLAAKGPGLQILEYLVEDSAPVELVIANPDSDPEIVAICHARNIPCWPFSDARLEEQVRGGRRFEFLLNLWSPFKLPDWLLDCADHRVNVHPGIVPQCRGNDNAMWTLRRNLPAGVSLLEMTSKMDAGGVYAQGFIEYGPSTRGSDLNQMLRVESVALFRRAWPGIFSGQTIAKPQDGGVVTFTRRMTEADRVRAGDDTMPLRDFVGWVNAHDFYPGTTAEMQLGDQRHRLRLSMPQPGAAEAPKADGPLDVTFVMSGLNRSSTDLSSGQLADLDLSELLQPPLRDPKVRFRDLAVTDADLRARLLAAVDEVLRDGRLLMGPAVEKWERLIADFCGAPSCVGVSSGTDAIYLALRALGIGAGDEVILPAMSWVATLNAVVMTGALPVLVDIGDDLNIDVAAIAPAITSRTRAIMPVHYTGRLCDMNAIAAIAATHKLLVVEDAAQAFGAAEGGRRAGSFGDTAAFSLNPMKVFPGYGEVGAVLMRSPEAEKRTKALRYLGTVNKEVCIEPALNFKIDTIQAAMMLVSFDRLEPGIRRRLQIATRYDEGLKNWVLCPPAPADFNDRRCVFFDYTIATPRRRELRKFLEGKGIEVKIRHPLLLCDHPAYRHLKRAPLPNAERLVKEILSLPIHDKLSDAQVDYVIDSVGEFFRG